MVTIVIDIFLFKRHYVLATQDLHEVPRKRKLNNHDQWRTRILELLYGVGYRPGTCTPFVFFVILFFSMLR